MSDDILIKWLESLVSFAQKNPFFTVFIIVMTPISIYGLYKLVDKLRYG